jgi:hypothetical protein
MSLERNKELAGAAIAIWSTGDFSRVLEIFTPNYVIIPLLRNGKSYGPVARRHPRISLVWW